MGLRIMKLAKASSDSFLPCKWILMFQSTTFNFYQCEMVASLWLDGHKFGGVNEFGIMEE